METINIQIEMTTGEVMEAELYPDVAPITVENFVSLIKEDYFKGIIFHRVIKDFMIQTGDPTGTGMGGSGKNIKGEFRRNGITNNLSHKRGVLSMARNSMSMDSASSQFFIVQKDSTYLDEQYAGFGNVLAGMDTVDKIAATATDSRDKPLSDIKIKTIRFIEIED